MAHSSSTRWLSCEVNSYNNFMLNGPKIPPEPPLIGIASYNNMDSKNCIQRPLGTL